MIYSNYDFLLLLPAFVVWFYSARTAAAQHIVLLVGSVVFIAWTGLPNLWVVLGVIAITLVYLHLDRAWKLGGFGLFVVIALLITNLAYFKYRGFLAENLDVRLSALTLVDWIVPLGISFYTFEAISAAVDLHRHSKPFRLRDWSLFILFFPHLIAGPIMRYRQLVPQFSARKILTRRNVSIGMHLFTLGFLKKLAADPLGQIIDPVWAAPSQASAPALLLALLGFYVQIYADFSGYTDMGRGVARMLGYRLPVNFRAPFFSASPPELFQRWHVSLSSWIKTFVYDTLALAVLRRIRVRKLQKLALFGVVLVVMSIFGFWHGAAWHFIVFGLWLGVMIVGWTAVTHGKAPSGICGWIVSIVALQSCWLIGLILFRADSLHDVAEFFIGLGRFSPTGLYPNLYWCLPAVAVSFLVQAANYWVRERKVAGALIAIRSSYLGAALVFALFLCGLGIKIGVDRDRLALNSQGLVLPTAGFIYFRF